MNQQDLLDLLGRASTYPSRAEFVTPKGVIATSFGEIWSWSSQAADALQGLATGARVAGVLGPSPHAIACAVGCLRSGIDFVSLPLPGRGQSPLSYLQQITEAMEFAGVERLVMEDEYLALVGNLAPSLRGRALAAEKVVASGQAGWKREPTPGRLIQFSSGTTGAPKGVVLTTSNIAESVVATLEALDVRPGDTSCQWLPLSHDMGLIGGLFAAWAGIDGRFLGGSPGHYVCMSPNQFLTRPISWLEACAASGATITAAPTFAYEMLARQLPAARKLDLSKLRVCLVGAEPILPQTLQSFAEAARAHGFDERALCPAYGMAEATLAVSLVRPHERWSTSHVTVDGERREYVRCGRPLRCVQVDAPHANTPGPILIRGAAVSDDYLPARALRPDGWLDSKDLGLFADGELVVTGRTDDMFCLAGKNLYAWELEREVDAMRGVRPGNCVVVPDLQGRYVLLFESTSADPNELRELLYALRRKLATYAGVGPSTVGCLPRGTLPKTPSGKLQRQKVRAALPEFVERCRARQDF